MPISFEITGDNKLFLDAMRKVQESVRQTSKTVNDALSGQARIVEELTEKTEQLAAEIAEAEKSGGTGIDQKKKQYEELTEQLEEAKQGFVDMQREFGKQSGTATQDQSSESLRTRLKQLTQQIVELTIEYRSMSASEQQSAKGQELLKKIEGLTDEAGTLRDAMDDANLSIKGVASDTKNWDALAGGINVATSAIGGLIGAASLFGAKEEELQEIQTKLQASLAISNALSVIQSNLQKESSLMLGIRAIQEKAADAAITARSAAEGKGVVATKAATVAQKVFNAVAKANPYVLLAGAILTVVGAFVAFSSGSKKVTEAEKKQREENERLKKAQEEMFNALGRSTGDVEAKYRSLQLQWKRLSNESEKAKWVKENTSKFNELGLSVNSVADAEDVLVKMAPQVIAALKAVAEADAYLDLYKEAVKRRAVEWENRIQQIATGDYYRPLKPKEGKRTYTRVEDEWKAAGLTYGDYTSNTVDRAGGAIKTEYNLQKSGIDKINAYREREAIKLRNRLAQGYDDEVNKYEKKWEEAQNKAIEAQDQIPKRLRYSGGGGSTPNKSGGGGGSNWNQAQADADAKKMLEEWKSSLTGLLQEVNQDIADANVESLDDSTSKVLKKLDEDEKKELAAIQKQREDLIKQRKELDISLWEKSGEKNDKYNYQEKTDTQYLAMIQADSPGLLEAIAERETQIRRNAQKQREEIYRQEAAAMRDYLKEYGSIEQQRLAITEEYEEKIAKATNEGERLAAKAAMDAALAEFDRKRTDISWESIFGNLAAYTSKELSGFKDQLRKTLSEGNMDVDQYKAIVERIEDINTAILAAQREENSFLGMSLKGGEERKRLTMEEAEARKQAAVAAKAQLDAETKLAAAEADVRSILSSSGVNYSGAINTANSQNILNAAAKDMGGTDGDAYKSLQAALLSLSGTEIEYQKARKVSVAAEQNHSNAVKKLNTFLGSWQKKLADLMPMFEQIAANLQSIPDLLGSLGINADSALGKAGQGIADTANSAMGAVSDYMSGNYVGAAAKGVDAIKSFGETVGLWSNSNRAEVEEANNKLAIATSVNTEAINRLTDEMHNASPLEAFKKWEQAEGLMRANEQSARQTLINNIGMYDGGHSLRHDLDDTYVNRIAGYLGVKKGGGSWNLEDLLRNTDAAKLNELFDDEEGRSLLEGLGKAIANAEDDGNYHGAFQDLLQYINDFSKDAYDNLRLSLQEAVTGVSFDSFKDGFKSALMDMDKSAKDFSDDFTQQLMQSVLNAKIEEEFGKELEDLYKGWADAFEDNTLTESEVADLNAKQQDITQRMMAVRDELAKVTGYDRYGSEDSATFKSASSFTQEQGDILNGRLTAIQMGVQVENALGRQIAASLQSMEQAASVSASTNTAVMEIRNMMIYTNSYLEDIANYSRKQYSEWGEKIDRIANKMSTL